jgi:phage terminase large subunit-like protein
MRIIEEITKDFMGFCFRNTNKPEFDYNKLEELTEKEKNILKGKMMKKLIELCYRDDGILWFSKFILGDLTYAGYPEPIRFNKLWMEWVQLIRTGDHLAILCPRQSGKSTFYSVILPIFRMFIFENYNVLIESASEEQANSLLGQVVRILENNEMLIQKRNKDAKWSTSDIEYNGGKLLARGVGSEVRGGTYDLIINDDILRSDNKFSDRDIEDFVDEELEPMIMVRKGQMMLVGTRKSFSDIFSSIEKRIQEGSKWKIKVYKAILDYENKTILCPERFTFEQLMQKRSIMGIRKFNKEYQNEVSGTGTGLFSDEIIQQAIEFGKSYEVHSSARPEDENHWSYIIGVDTARAGTASSDYSVAIVLAYDPEKQYKRICWIWRKKGLKISEQVKQIAELAKQFNYPTILVEKNNVGQEFIDEMVDHYNLSVESFITTKTSKEDLIRLLITSFENEKMIIPYSNERSREMMESLLEELRKFVVEVTRAGNEIMKGSGSSHDDQVISLSLAVKCSQMYSGVPMAFSVDKPKRMSELEYFSVTNDANTLIRL